MVAGINCPAAVLGSSASPTYPTPARAIASACRQLPVASSALDPSSIALQEARKLCSEQRDLKPRQLPAISSSWLRLGWP